MLKSLLLTTALFLVGSCSGVHQKQIVVPPIPSPPPVESFVEKKTDDIPRAIDVVVTLGSPEDLKVSSGDFVEKNQVLADRASERRSLLEKQELLKISLSQVSRKIPTPQRPLNLMEMPSLPEANFSVEEMAIAKNKLVVGENLLALTQQADLINSLQSSGASSDSIIHEKSKYKIIEMRLAKASLDLSSAEASLESAKSDRNYLEYRHSLESQRRQLKLQEQALHYERDNSRYLEQLRQQEFRKASLGTQLSGIEEKIALLSETKSPFSGTVRKVKYESQNNSSITASITIDVGQQSSVRSGSTETALLKLE